MKIGDLVEYNDLAESLQGRLGVIVRSDEDSQGWEWFEVLVKGELYVTPEYQLSPARPMDSKTNKLKNKSKKARKNSTLVQK